MKRAFALGLLWLGFVAIPSKASAGGFYLLDRGTRALGRGGAFVAGADDPGALWYNPAGIGFAGEQLLVDATLGFLDVEFTRIDGSGNPMPTVRGTNAPLPIPTIAGTFDFGLEHFHFGVGLFAPNGAILEYPNSPEAAQRYSLQSMNGTLTAMVAAGLAWTPLPNELSFGVAVHTVLGSYSSRAALSACDGAICTFPEDPEYDAIAQLSLSPIITATVVGGITWNPGPVRFGASFMTPFAFSGDASIKVRTPSASSFDGAFVRTRAESGPCSEASAPDDEVRADPNHPCRNTTASTTLQFPFVLRVGAELLAVENLRLEAAFVWETWSMQREVNIVQNDVWIADSLGFLDYEVGTMTVPRNMRDTYSVRLGGEYTIDGSYQVRLGGYYENSSFDDAHLTPLTIDSDKIVVAGGFSMRIFDGVWADLMVGYAHLFPRQVRDSQVARPNSIRPQGPSSESVYVGNGDYSFTLPFLGIGMRWQADWAPPPVAAEENEPTQVETTPAPTWYEGQGGAAEAAQTPAPVTPTAVEEERPEVQREQSERPDRRQRRGDRGRRPRH